VWRSDAVCIKQHCALHSYQQAVIIGAKPTIVDHSKDFLTHHLKTDPQPLNDVAPVCHIQIFPKCLFTHEAP
jgi:hypothetical protein